MRVFSCKQTQHRSHTPGMLWVPLTCTAAKPSWAHRAAAQLRTSVLCHQSWTQCQQDQSRFCLPPNSHQETTEEAPRGEELATCAHATDIPLQTAASHKHSPTHNPGGLPCCIPAEELWDLRCGRGDPTPHQLSCSQICSHLLQTPPAHSGCAPIRREQV